MNYRSKGRALLLLCLVSDVGMDDPPSRLLPGSHLEMSRLLFPAGDEGLPGAYEGQSQIPLPESKGAQMFATGSAGDVFILHPFSVHAASWPQRGDQPRFLAQPPITISMDCNLMVPRVGCLRWREPFGLASAWKKVPEDRYEGGEFPFAAGVIFLTLHLSPDLSITRRWSI